MLVQRYIILKGVWHEIFDFSIFHESVSLSIPLGSFQLFSKICRDNREWMFISGVNDTGDKLFGGVNDTADKFIGGVRRLIFVTDFLWSAVS